MKCNEYNYLTLALRDSFENMTKTKPDLLKMKINKVSVAFVAGVLLGVVSLEWDRRSISGD